MTLESIKREFVSFMEDIHGSYAYPRNFFGCLMSVIIETEPVSQERIMKLTGYSQATVSLTLQKIQLMLPVRTIKKVGDRKRYYSYDGPPEKFLLDLLVKRVEVQDVDISLITATLEKLGIKERKDVNIRRFIDYLKNLKLYLELIHKLRTMGYEPVKQLIETGSLAGYPLKESKELEKGDLAEFLRSLRESSMASYPTQMRERDDTPEYLMLKNEYFSNIKSGLNPLYAQTIANQFIVIHNVLLEGCITQEQIERSTQLPRSTISEILNDTIQRDIIQVAKKEGSRIKFYHPAISFVDIMLGNVDRVAHYANTVKTQLLELTNRVKKMRDDSVKGQRFLDLLIAYQKVYSFLIQFNRNLKVELVKHLKMEFDQGFVFI